MDLPFTANHLLPLDGLQKRDCETRERLSKLGREYLSFFKNRYGGPKIPQKISSKDPLQALSVRQAWDNHMLLCYLRQLDAKLDRLLLAHGKLPE